MTSKPNSPAKFVAYFRVSTAKQGVSGLGLEAQHSSVERYVAGVGGQIVETFQEVESGKKNDRAELAKALKACRVMRATLIIAKLDRLARNVAFVSNLMEAGVDFVAVDMPQANKLTIHIIAAMAEHEREMISQRTKAALQAAKARGVKLGNPSLIAGNASTSKAANKAKTVKARAKAKDVMTTIRQAQKAGATTLQSLADALNARGVPSPSGKGAWYPATVSRVMAAA